MPLPNFLIISAQKSGTSWIRENLRSHPDVYCVKEEIQFFNLDANFKLGLPWYEKHCSHSTTEKMVGEKTTMLFVFDLLITISLFNIIDFLRYH